MAELDELLIAMPENQRAAKRLLGEYVAEGGQFNVIMFHMSLSCNKACIHCYRNAGGIRPTWTLEKALKLVKKYRGKGWIVLPEMAELISETAHLLPVYKESGNHEFSTNGEWLLEHPDLIPLVKENEIKNLRISLNHPRKHYEWTESDRERSRKSLRKSVDEGFQTTAVYIVSRSTLDGLEAHCEEARNLGAQEVSFLSYQYILRATRAPEEVLRPADILYFHRVFKQLREQYDPSQLSIEKMGTLGPEPEPIGCLAKLVNDGKFCWAGEGPHGKYYYVESDGSVYPCMTLGTPELKIGQMDQDGEIVITQNPLEGFHRQSCFCQTWSQERSERDSKDK